MLSGKRSLCKTVTHHGNHKNTKKKPNNKIFHFFILITFSKHPFGEFITNVSKFLIQYLHFTPSHLLTNLKNSITNSCKAYWPKNRFPFLVYPENSAQKKPASCIKRSRPGTNKCFIAIFRYVKSCFW